MMLLGNKYPWIKEELNAVRTILNKVSDSASEDIRNEIKNIIHQEDDLLRALLVILASRFGNYDSDKMIQLAAIVELLYLASRLQVTGFIGYGEMYSHDQLLDRCFAGDYILAESMSMMAERLHKEEVHAIVKCYKQLIVREHHHLSQRFVLHNSKRHYLKHIEARSGAILEMCFRVGAIQSNSNDQVIKQLSRVGYHMGMANQLIDDLLDMDHDEELMGKTLGINIKEGYTHSQFTTYIVLFLRKPADYLQKPIREKHIRRLIELMYQHGAIDKTRLLVQLYTRKAYNEINMLPNGEYKQVVFDTASHLLERRF